MSRASAVTSTQPSSSAKATERQSYTSILAWLAMPRARRFEKVIEFQ